MKGKRKLVLDLVPPHQRVRNDAWTTLFKLPSFYLFVLVLLGTSVLATILVVTHLSPGRYAALSAETVPLVAVAVALGAVLTVSLLVRCRAVFTRFNTAIDLSLRVRRTQSSRFTVSRRGEEFDIPHAWVRGAERLDRSGALKIQVCGNLWRPQFVAVSA